MSHVAIKICVPAHDMEPPLGAVIHVDEREPDGAQFILFATNADGARCAHVATGFLELSPNIDPSDERIERLAALVSSAGVVPEYRAAAEAHFERCFGQPFEAWFPVLVQGTA